MVATKRPLTGASNPARKRSKPEKKPDDWIFSQPLWTCKKCTLCNYCDQTECFGCKAPRPVSEVAKPTPELPKEEPDPQPPIVLPTRRPQLRGTTVGESIEIDPYYAGPIDLAALFKKQNKKPDPPKALPPVTMDVAVKRERKSRFDRAPAGMATDLNTAASWDCFHCKQTNAADRPICFQCQSSKALSTTTSSGAVMWNCRTCSRQNYPKDTKCSHCGTMKPALALKNFSAPRTMQAARRRKPVRYDVYVGNLAEEVNQVELSQEFNKYGSVIGCRRPPGSYAFVQFATLEGAAYAKHAADGTFLGGKKLRCQWPKMTSIPQDQIAEVENRLKMFQPDLMTTKFELFVGNLSDDITEQDVKECFDAFGIVVGCRKPGSYAFVQFNDLHGAMHAKSLADGSFIRGRRINVQWPKDYDVSKINLMLTHGGVVNPVMVTQG